MHCPFIPAHSTKAATAITAHVQLLPTTWQYTFHSAGALFVVFLQCRASGLTELALVAAQITALKLSFQSGPDSSDCVTVR